MDYTKTKTFAAFKHVIDKNIYWVNCGWMYDQEIPGLFPYDTKEEKKIVLDVSESLIDNWKIKDLQLITLKIISCSDISPTKKKSKEIPLIVEDVEVVKKRTRGPNKTKA